MCTLNDSELSILTLLSNILCMFDKKNPQSLSNMIFCNFQKSTVLIINTCLRSVRITLSKFLIWEPSTVLVHPKQFSASGTFIDWNRTFIIKNKNRKLLPYSKNIILYIVIYKLMVYGSKDMSQNAFICDVTDFRRQLLYSN